MDATADEPRLITTSSAGTSQRRRGTRTRWLIVLTMAVGGAIRLIGVGWALPYMSHPDEPVNMNIAHHMVEEGTANPGWFVYPSLFYDIQAAVHSGYVITGQAVGHLGDVADAGPVEVIAPMGVAKATDSPAVVLARLVSVIASVLTVGLVALVVHLAGGRRGAMVGAAGLAAIAPILVGYSWFVTPDTLSALTATAAVAAALRVLRRGDTIDYVVAGALVGLATGSKYNAVVVVVPLMVAHLFRHRVSHVDRLLLAGALSVAAFVLTTPFALWDYSRFRHDLGSVLQHYSNPGHAGYEGGTWSANAGWLIGGFGLLVLGLLGLRWSRRPRSVAVLASFVLSYYVVVSLPTVRFERNLLPAVPTLVALIALGFEGLWRRASRPTSPRWARAALFTVVVVGTAWPAIGTTRRVEAALHDPSAAARHWIESNVRPGATIVIDTYSPFVDPEVWRVVPTWFVLKSRDQVEQTNPEVVVVTRAGSGRFLNGVDPLAEGFLLQLDTEACERALFPEDGIWVFVLRCGDG